MTSVSRRDGRQPLADRLRPRRFEEFHGQQHLCAPGKPLRVAIEMGWLHSLLLWGPPGSGKTTLARLIAAYSDAEFISLSAVLAGVSQVRTAVARAQTLWRDEQRRTLLFIDEVHRFNKAQQDAFLPFVEDGTLVFIGATTENPSFTLNNALLSRLKVYVLNPLQPTEIAQIIEHALADEARGLGRQSLELTPHQRDRLARSADGDARYALSVLEIAAELVQSQSVSMQAALDAVLEGRVGSFDKGGDWFYEQVSALHKAVRGSDPDAALYWLARMLQGGCDPLYIARRILRMASEDVGNADPRGLHIALDAWQTYERLGSPEGELALAQAVVYLACAPKSNAVYKAYQTAAQDAREAGSLPVPLHLRNAPTTLLRNLGYGKDYRYAHDEPEGYAAGVSYFPEALGQRRYYHPVARGLEIKIGEKLAHLRRLDENEGKK